MNWRPCLPIDAVQELRNLGPASVRMLKVAGISTEGELPALGSVAAYLAVKQRGLNATLNLLWPLEGALTRQVKAIMSVF